MKSSTAPAEPSALRMTRRGRGNPKRDQVGLVFPRGAGSQVFPVNSVPPDEHHGHEG